MGSQSLEVCMMLYITLAEKQVCQRLHESSQTSYDSFRTCFFLLFDEKAGHTYGRDCLLRVLLISNLVAI